MVTTPGGQSGVQAIRHRRLHLRRAEKAAAFFLLHRKKRRAFLVVVVLMKIVVLLNALVVQMEVTLVWGGGHLLTPSPGEDDHPKTANAHYWRVFGLLVDDGRALIKVRSESTPDEDSLCLALVSSGFSGTPRRVCWDEK